MISVPRPAKPAGFPDAKIQAAEAGIQRLVAAGTLPASEHFEPLWKASKDAFCSAQFGKCAYCETRFVAGYPGDIEHKRPKTEVKEPSPGQQGNRDDLSGKPPGRSWAQAVVPGYWWLAYRWENWVFSCNKCNTWKACRFPLASHPQTPATMQPGREQQEAPLLLDPHDPALQPRDHLSWNELGQIRGTTPQGRCTIDVCGLDRTSLDQERARVAGRLLQELGDVSCALNESNVWRNRVLARLIEFCDPDAPYSAMCRDLLQAKFLSYEDLKTLQERLPGE